MSIFKTTMNNSPKSALTRDIIILIPFFMLFTGVTYFVCNHIFFWDTIQLGSLHAHYYYENHFNSLLLPNNIDSGHIPAFGMYLALVWILFGKTLFISHFAMLPFILGIIFQGYRLIKKFISFPHQVMALIVFLCDATLLSQMVLISPDVPLVFFFLLGLNAVLNNRKSLVTMAVCGLFLTSMRGMMISGSLLILDIILHISFGELIITFNQLLKKSMGYLPALLIWLFYSYYHYRTKGWIRLP